MADLQAILLSAFRELGPDASDGDLVQRMTELIEALPDADRAEVDEQMLRLTDSTLLAHLRELAEAPAADEVPGQIVEKRGDG